MVQQEQNIVESALQAQATCRAATQHLSDTAGQEPTRPNIPYENNMNKKTKTTPHQKNPT